MNNDEFTKLLALKKVFTKSEIILPANGNKDSFDLKSVSTDDEFLLDVDRCGRIEISKYKIQTRYSITKLPMARVDIDSPPHINPDGTKVSRNHIHIFRETDNDTGNLPWAYELKTFQGFSFDENTTFMDVFHQFCVYCHIIYDTVQGVL